MRQYSTSSSSEQEQPRESQGGPNIFKDTRSRKCTTNRGKKCNICTPMDVSVQVILGPITNGTQETGEQPQQISDGCEDIENAHDFRVRVSTLRRPGQPPNAIILCPSRRRRPAGWPTGVQSGFPPRPDSSEKPDLPPKPVHLRTWQCTQSDLEQDQNQDECEYLEPVSRHKYEEPDDSAFQMDKVEEEEEENHHDPWEEWKNSCK